MEGFSQQCIWDVFYNGIDTISQAGSCPLGVHKQPQPFPAQAGCLGKAVSALAEAWEELQECARYQAAPLALIAAFLPIPCHDKFPEFVIAANSTRLCNEEHCSRVPMSMPRDKVSQNYRTLRGWKGPQRPSSPNPHSNMSKDTSH